MTNFNSNIAQVEFSVFTSMAHLLDMGWSFDDLIEHEIENAEAKGENTLDWDSAQQKVGEKFDVRISVSGTSEKFHTFYTIHSANNHAEFGDKEDCGDNEETIKNIVQLMEEKKVWKISDYSTDGANNYAPLFAGFETQK